MLGILPADEFALFDAPAVKKVSTSAGATVPLIGADPTRVLVVISNGSSNAVYVGPAGTTGMQQGIFSQPNPSAPITFDFNTYGAFVGQGWEVWSAAGGNVVTVYTVSLRIPPEMRGYANVFKKAGAIEGAPALLPTRRQLVQSALRKLPPAVTAALRGKCPKILGEG